MSKKPKKSKAARKPKTPSIKSFVAPASPPPIIATCEVCGETYHAGAPHSAFCRGTKETQCSKCSRPAILGLVVALCRTCEEVFCDDCGDTAERRCNDCEEAGAEA